MNNTGFSKQIEITPILGWVLSDDELAIRARSLLRWKIRYNSIHVEAERGHVTLLGQVDSSSDRRSQLARTKMFLMSALAHEAG
jgi:hypothetical protein